MTLAICLACSEQKLGAFVSCKVCGYRPGTGWELAVSMICSDSVIPVSQLESLASDLRRDRSLNLKHAWLFDEGADVFISRRFDDPSWRDIFSLQRQARQSLFAKQLNFHYEGTDGYHSAVILRGKDMAKAEFDALLPATNGDVFFLETYVDGKRVAEQIGKAVWYCFKDINYYLRKQATYMTLEVAVLNTEVGAYTTSYLERRHGLDLSSVLGS